jgi:hypothetical protein
MESFTIFEGGIGVLEDDYARGRAYGCITLFAVVECGSSSPSSASRIWGGVAKIFQPSVVERILHLRIITMLYIVGMRRRCDSNIVTMQMDVKTIQK